ncbi:MAG: hypothetical protein KZY61_00855 [Clostridiaceae bacterium]|nr:hypothetical protein [Clostridiaceae bacterium]MBW4860349.1 hypothetical protein [Clostridiaceae bacterium]MBW4867204.1 hypothetical protein [Clostridiaceae bacterium]HHV27411.1 hypothetical protein [Tissierellia bacterium]
MAISIKINNPCSTKSALEFYTTYKEAFGNVISAEMIGNTSEGDYKFKLANDRGEEIEFEGELGSGYGGEGPTGTLKILQMAGFDVEKEFIKSNSSFKLTK